MRCVQAEGKKTKTAKVSIALCKKSRNQLDPHGAERINYN